MLPLLLLPLVFSPCQDPAPTLTLDEPLALRVDAEAQALVSPGLAAGGDETVAHGVPVSLEVAEGGVHRIELRAPLDDAYLILRDAEEGTVLAEDDDGGLGTHARITAELEAGRKYRVEAGVLGKGPADLELSLHRGAAEPLDAVAAFEAGIADAREAAEWALAQEEPAIRRKGLDKLEDAAIEMRSLGLHTGERDHLAEALTQFRRVHALTIELHGAEAAEIASVDTWIADLAFRLDRPDDGIAAFEEAARLYAAHGEPLEEAEMLRRIGQNLSTRPARRAEAESALERALAVARAEEGLDALRTASDVLYTWSLLHSDQGRASAAVTRMEAAVAVLDGHVGVDDENLFQHLRTLTILLEESGRTADALSAGSELADRCLAELGRAHAHTVEALAGLGYLRFRASRFDAAAEAYEDALAALRELGASGTPSGSTEVSILRNLSVNLGMAGHMAEGRRTIRESLDIALRDYGPTHPETLASRQMYGVILNRTGHYREAAREFQELIRIQQERLGPDHPEVAWLTHELMANVDGTSEEEDLELLLQTAQVLERQPQVEHRRFLLNIYKSLAVAFYNAGDEERELEYLRRQLELARELHPPEHPEVLIARLEIAQRELARREGEEDDLLALWGEIIPLLERGLPPESDTLQTYQSIYALLLEGAGERKRALELHLEIQRGGDRYAMRAVHGMPERDALRVLAKAHESLEHLLWAWARYVGPEETPEPALARAVYDYVVAWQGRGLRAVMRSRDAMRASASPELQQRLDRLKEVQGELSRRFHGSGEGMAALFEERLRLETEIHDDLLAREEGEADFALLRGALRPGEAALDFVEAHAHFADGEQERIQAWIVLPDRDAPIFVNLGDRAELATLVRDWLQVEVGARARGGGRLARQAEKEEKAPGAALYRRLWEPLAPHLEGVERILVSPCADLGGLPLEIVQDPEGGFLVERHAFVYLQDLASLPSARASGAAQARGSSLLAVGAVDFGGAASRSSETAQGRGLRGALARNWQPLPATARELDDLIALHASVAPNAERRVLRGSEATEERLKELLPEADVAHLATHGFFQPEGTASLWEEATAAAVGGVNEVADEGEALFAALPGLLAGLVCAGANQPLAEGDDGYLTAEELSWLDLTGVRLVVLSACETGLGRPQAGEGMMGLRRALRGAGVDTVISSLWAVDDAATAELMADAYRRMWVEGVDPASALRAAQLSMLERNRAEFDHPRPATWGAFVTSTAQPASR